uniref:Uncharacterized protein n=1 Tax=Mus musculus TaxID=10090 RepID=Q8BPB4_MOUSE|nr:unnamed protein product [Mus musculus]
MATLGCPEAGRVAAADGQKWLSSGDRDRICAVYRGLCTVGLCRMVPWTHGATVFGLEDVSRKPCSRTAYCYSVDGDSALTLKQIKLHRALGENQTGQCSRMGFDSSYAIYIIEKVVMKVGHSSFLSLKFLLSK